MTLSKGMFLLQNFKRNILPQQYVSNIIFNIMQFYSDAFFSSIAFSFNFPRTKLVTNYLKDNGDVGRTKEHRKCIRHLVIEGKSMITKNDNSKKNKTEQRQ